MTTAWQMQRAVWRQPWQRRRGSPASWLVLAAMTLPPLIFGLLSGQGLRAFAAIAGALALCWWWWNAVQGLVDQNHPDLARLVPGQLAALRRQLLAQAALVFALALPCAMLLPGPIAAKAWAVALLMLALAWLVAEPWCWVPASLLPMLGQLSPLRVWEWPALLAAQPLALQVLAAAAALAALRAVLGQGGAYHRRSHGRLRAWASVQRGEILLPAADRQGRALRLLGRCFSWPQQVYARWLLARPTPANALQRLDLGLQAGGLWPMSAWVFLLVAALLALLAQALPGGLMGQAAAEAMYHSRFGLCIGSFSLAMAPLSGRCATLWRRRREQALLVLLPGLPQGAALSAALEAKWRREFLAAWLPVGALVLALAHLGGGDTLRFAAASMALYLQVGWLAQHWHRRLTQGPQVSASMRWLVLHAVIAALAGGAEWLAVPATASLAAGAAAYALLAWRASPPAAWLPAGRPTITP